MASDKCLIEMTFAVMNESVWVKMKRAVIIKTRVGLDTMSVVSLHSPKLSNRCIKGKNAPCIICKINELQTSR